MLLPYLNLTLLQWISKFEFGFQHKSDTLALIWICFALLIWILICCHASSFPSSSQTSLWIKGHSTFLAASHSFKPLFVSPHWVGSIPHVTNYIFDRQLCDVRSFRRLSKQHQLFFNRRGYCAVHSDVISGFTLYCLLKRKLDILELSILFITARMVVILNRALKRNNRTERGLCSTAHLSKVWSSVSPTYSSPSG